MIFMKFLCFCRESSGIWQITSGIRLKKDILIVPPGFTHCPLALHTLTEPYERIITCVSKDFINFFLSKWHAQNVYKTILNRPTLFKTSGTPYEFLCRYLEYNAIEANLESPYADAFLAGNTLCFYQN